MLFSIVITQEGKIVIAENVWFFFFPSPLMKTQVKSQVLQSAKKSKAINGPFSRTEEGKGRAITNLALTELSDRPGSPASWPTLGPQKLFSTENGNGLLISALTHSHPHTPFEMDFQRAAETAGGQLGTPTVLALPPLALHSTPLPREHPSGGWILWWKEAR